MKANDFRLGNLYHFEDVSGMVVERVDYIENEMVDCNHLDLIHPIPLTEEWLLKFGFVNGYLRIVNGLLVWVDDELWVTYTNGVRSGCLNHINHVHQLQNLYFALTGEELTLKS